ncbi:hypothetical protein DNTS_021077 [Danionella cerebrum]|uniref:SH3 domain-containing protein n=1 Tax=Danionella cerebrum TaxID=2873325 RepID=A0A553Q299_9TELE|nr:hypothetical protein DNTS_021077 [Danionella translucida]
MALIMSDLNDSLIDVSSDSFWEVGNYKRTVKRVEDANRLCNDLMSCIHERAKIEKSYSTQLSEWAKRWRQLLEKGPQTGSLEHSWCALMVEAEQVSELHLQVKHNLVNEDLEMIRTWQRETFHKQMMGGFKESKEIEDGFRRAQKPWSKRLKEVEVMKKAYHTACREQKTATSRENSSRMENSSAENVKKLQEKLEKSQQEVLKSRERYERSLEELEKVTPQYMENMELVFEQWQQFEGKRLNFFKEILMSVRKHLDLSDTHTLSSIYQALEDSIQAADVVEDLKAFRSNHGPGMSMNWPSFEAYSSVSFQEWSMELNRTLSRRETKKKHTEGVTLTAISQNTEQNIKSSNSIQSKAARNPFDEDDDDDVKEAETELAVESSPVRAERAVHSQSATAAACDEAKAVPFSSNGNPFEEESGPEELCVQVRALYDYEGQEQDELSFSAGDEMTKLSEEDDQGWCKGRLSDGTVGLYPANYVEESK